MLAVQALHSRVHGLRKHLGVAIDGASPVVCVDGYYRLNSAAGVDVDVAAFESLAAAGDQEVDRGQTVNATALYGQAADLYRGDLSVDGDLHAVVERERLRTRHLSLLAFLGTATFDVGDYGRCLVYAQRLVDHDPCREDAHRLLMRCFVRRGERAQALHQYRWCTELLRSAFDAAPELATAMLFEQIRRAPESV
jgi:DNA-binding SARP family transcriptional activator